MAALGPSQTYDSSLCSLEATMDLGAGFVEMAPTERYVIALLGYVCR